MYCRSPQMQGRVCLRLAPEQGGPEGATSLTAEVLEDPSFWPLDDSPKLPVTFVQGPLSRASYPHHRGWLPTRVTRCPKPEQISTRPSTSPTMLAQCSRTSHIHTKTIHAALGYELNRVSPVFLCCWSPNSQDLRM